MATERQQILSVVAAGRAAPQAPSEPEGAQWHYAFDPGRRPTRVRIPLLVDLVLVDDRMQMAALNEHPNVSRLLPPHGTVIGRMIARRIDPTLTVNGEMLPVFAARTNAPRAERQRKLENRLTCEVARAIRRSPECVALGRYVAGCEPAEGVGVVAQRLIGRLFVADYRATAETYAAAKVIAEWPRALPPTAWWWRISGTLARSNALLWAAAHDDPLAIHATAIAVHNVVDTLDRMRTRAAKRGPTGTAAEALRECLVAPTALLRVCTQETRVPFLEQPLQPGTLIVFRLQKAHAGTGDNGFAFFEGDWNECPAHAFVPAVLEEVWAAAAKIWPAAEMSDARAGGTDRGQHLLTRAFSSTFEGTFSALNRIVPWYRLPTPLAVLNLLALRNVLRKRNLYDTEAPAATDAAPIAPVAAEALCTRTTDGTYNDLANPRMGCAGARFGRNVPHEYTHPDTARLLTPSPRLISQRLLRREQFVPATTLNLLAAAWIQFQVHDWFNHKLSDDEYAEIPLAKGDPWFENPMRVRRTVSDTNTGDPPAAPPVYANTKSHWWDASQIYGTTDAAEHAVRAHEHGKLRILDNGLLPPDPTTGIDVTGSDDNWWVGLSLLHTLFTLEHNAICDHLRREYPTWGDDRLFATARLINAALIAKIHTVEWTPAILAHPVLKIGMNANWWGIAGEQITKLAGRLSASEAISGIPASSTDHHSAPYALTEEFVAVYRMHPLMPDDFRFYSFEDGRAISNLTLTEVSGRNARTVIEGTRMTDLLYSFGVTHPGAVTLHNYPRGLQDLQRLNGDRLDLASVEILRDRERGVPRYNEFRRQLHLPPARSFETLTPNPEWARELREVYANEIENVDLMVGMYAEAPPPGFGFSDTAFRVFILMASRRLKSDRFFTTDFTPNVYTPLGMEWVQTNDMRRVLMRHYPELGPALRLVNNAFAPWRSV